jgi:hypothetical protein
MDKTKPSFVGVVGVLAMVAGCTSSGSAHPPPAINSPTWSAVGIPAGPAQETISATSVRSPRSATSVSTPHGTPTSHRSTLSRPRWASGVGAPAFPTPRDVDQHSIDAVALAGARAFASADTAVDREDPQHTAVRAALARWLTPDYAHRVLTAKIVGPLGVEWDTWYRHRAYVMVTAQPSGEDHPPDRAALAARKVVLRERAVGRDGWRGAPTTAVVVVVLKKVNKVWRIDSDEPS